MSEKKIGSWSLERRRKQSERMKELRKKYPLPSMKGTKWSEERRENYSKKMKQYHAEHPDALNEFKKESRKYWEQHPESRAKGFKWSAESREIFKKMLNQPEQKRARSNKAKEAWSNPDIRRRRMQNSKNRWTSRSEEEIKAHMSYMQSFLSKTSKPQLEIYSIVKQHYPEAKLEYPVANKLLDIAIPEQRIDIEYDGLYWHQNTARDEARDALLQKLGWVIVRVKEGTSFDINTIHELANSRRMHCHEDSLSRRA